MNITRKRPGPQGVVGETPAGVPKPNRGHRAGTMKAQTTFFATGLLCMVAACSFDPVADLAEQAERAVANRDLASAIALYADATELAPQNAQLQWRLARALIAVRDLQRAESAIRAAARLGFDVGRTRPALAEVLLYQRRYEDLLALSAQGLDGAAAGALLAHQARALSARGDHASARELLGQAAEQTPNLGAVLLAQAELAYAQGDLPTASERLNALRRIEPDHPGAPVLAGDIAVLQGDLEAAETEYGAALDLGHGHWTDRLRRGQLRLLREDLAGAAEDARLLLDNATPHDDVLVFAYRAWHAFDRTEEAEAGFRQVLQRDPDNAQARYLLALILLSQGREAEADTLLHSVIALAPAHAGARRQLAAGHLAAGNPAAAREMIRPLAAANSADSEAARLLLSSELELGNHDAALALLDVAGLDPHGERMLRTQIGSLRGQAADTAPPLPRIAGTGPLELKQPQPRRYRLPEPTRTVSDEQSSADAPALIARAGAAFESGEAQTAAALLKQALTLEPYNSEALTGLVSLALNGVADSDAMRHLDDALAENPDELAIWELKADLAESGAQVTEFESALRRVLELDPARDDVRARLAFHYLADPTSVDEAERLLAGHDQSTLPELQVAIADTLYARNRLDEALAAYQRLLKTTPYTALYLRLAALHELRGNATAARALLDRVSRLGGNDDFAILARARLAAIGGEAWEARRLVESTTLPVDHPEVLRTRYYIASHEEKAAETRELAARVWQREPGLPALLHYTRTLHAQNAPDNAITLLEDWREDHPDDLPAIRDLVTLYAATDRVQEKVAALEQVVQLAPEDATAQNNLAWALQDLDPPRALAHARRANELMPGSPDFTDTLAVVLAKNRQFTDALQLTDDAAGRSGDRAPLALRRAEILVMAGRLDDAVNDLRSISPAEIAVDERERRMHLLAALAN